MTTASAAFAAIKTRLSGAALPLRYQNEDAGPLADRPTAFGYVEFLTDPAILAGFGGGRGSNRYRNPARLVIYVFVPAGQGLAPAIEKAETLAALFRSYRTADISCFEASVYPGGSGADIKPPGLDSEIGNYFYAVVEVAMFYDQIG